MFPLKNLARKELMHWNLNKIDIFIYIFKCIILNGNDWILARISLKFDPKGPIDESALGQVA